MATFVNFTDSKGNSLGKILGSPLCGSPINVRVKADTLSVSSTDVISFHHIILRVLAYIEGEDTIVSTFTVSVTNSEVVDIDISSALRAVFDSYEYTPDPDSASVSTKTYPVVHYTLVAYDEYLKNGEDCTQGEVTFPGETEATEEQDVKMAAYYDESYEDTSMKCVRLVSNQTVDNNAVVDVKTSDTDDAHNLMDMKSAGSGNSILFSKSVLGCSCYFILYNRGGYGDVGITTASFLQMLGSLSKTYLCIFSQLPSGTSFTPVAVILDSNSASGDYLFDGEKYCFGIYAVSNLYDSSGDEVTDGDVSKVFTFKTVSGDTYLLIAVIDNLFLNLSALEAQYNNGTLTQTEYNEKINALKCSSIDDVLFEDGLSLCYYNAWVVVYLDSTTGGKYIYKFSVRGDYNNRNAVNETKFYGYYILILEDKNSLGQHFYIPISSSNFSDLSLSSDYELQTVGITEVAKDVYDAAMVEFAGGTAVSSYVTVRNYTVGDKDALYDFVANNSIQGTKGDLWLCPNVASSLSEVDTVLTIRLTYYQQFEKGGIATAYTPTVNGICVASYTPYLYGMFFYLTRNSNGSQKLNLHIPDALPDGFDIFVYFSFSGTNDSSGTEGLCAVINRSKSIYDEDFLYKNRKKVDGDTLVIDYDSNTKEYELCTRMNFASFFVLNISYIIGSDWVSGTLILDDMQVFNKLYSSLDLAKAAYDLQPPYTVASLAGQRSLEADGGYVDGKDFYIEETIYSDYATALAAIGGKAEQVYYDFKALNGAYSDLERLQCNGQKKALAFTRKPTTSPEIVCEGETFVYTPPFSGTEGGGTPSDFVGYSLLTLPCSPTTVIETISMDGEQELGGIPLYALPEEALTEDRYQFRFINGLGVLESFSCYALRNDEVNIESEEYTLGAAETFSTFARGIIRKTSDRETMKLNSGPLTRDWAAWFVHEFMMAQNVWINIGNINTPNAEDRQDLWVRCHIVTDDKTKTINREKSNLLSIDFSVKLDINGSINRNIAI